MVFGSPGVGLRLHLVWSDPQFGLSFPLWCMYLVLGLELEELHIFLIF
jgi:hypothetical protein